MSGSISPGRFVWFDLMTPDPEGAMAFYTKVVGWTLTDFAGAGPEGAPPYKMWTAGERPVGGVMQLSPEAKKGGAPPHWLAYVTVPDCQAAVDQALEEGGEILMEATTLPGIGTFAVLRDPQGAVFSPYTPEEDDPNWGGPPQVGGFSWHELATTDPAEAFEFYSGIFGWQKTDSLDMGELGIYQMYGGSSGAPYGGIYRKPDAVPGPPHWLYYILVPDIHSAVTRVKEHGGQLLNGPEEVPGGDLVAQCMDPQGGVFALHTLGSGEG